jgi:hypothetical protein
LLPAGEVGELNYENIVQPDIETGLCPENYFLCAEGLTPDLTDKEMNSVRTCVPDDIATKASKDKQLYHQHMVDNFCPVTSIQIIKKNEKTVMNKIKYTYVEM